MNKLEESVRSAQGAVAYGSDDNVIRICTLVLLLFPLAILAGLAVAIIVGGR
jgi:phage shock protein PspC (stress-responsive transcriptional regulator)